MKKLSLVETDLWLSIRVRNALLEWFPYTQMFFRAAWLSSLLALRFHVPSPPLTVTGASLAFSENASQAPASGPWSFLTLFPQHVPHGSTQLFLSLCQILRRPPLNTQSKTVSPSPALRICFALPYLPVEHLWAPHSMYLHVTYRQAPRGFDCHVCHGTLKPRRGSGVFQALGKWLLD